MTKSKENAPIDSGVVLENGTFYSTLQPLSFNTYFNTNKTKLLMSNKNEIVMSIHDKEIVRLAENGDIFINGHLAENDLEVVDGFRTFLKQAFGVR